MRVLEASVLSANQTRSHIEKDYPSKPPLREKSACKTYHSRVGSRASLRHLPRASELLILAHLRQSPCALLRLLVEQPSALVVAQPHKTFLLRPRRSLTLLLSNRRGAMLLPATVRLLGLLPASLLTIALFHAMKTLFALFVRFEQSLKLHLLGDQLLRALTSVRLEVEVVDALQSSGHSLHNELLLGGSRRTLQQLYRDRKRGELVNSKVLL